MLLVQSKLRIEEKEFPRDPSSSPSLVWLSWEEFHSKKSNNKKKKRGKDLLLPVPTKWRKCPPGTQSTTLVGVAKEEDIPFFYPLVFRPDPYHSYKHFRVGGDWPDRLLEALWAYRTSICIATGQTPFSLVVGMDAILPSELDDSFPARSARRRYDW
jgi:hypothetical protein